MSRVVAVVVATDGTQLGSAAAATSGAAPTKLISRLEVHSCAISRTAEIAAGTMAALTAPSEPGVLMEKLAVPNGAPALPPATLHHLKEAFLVFDRDGSGSITSTELGAVLKHLGRDATEVELADMLSELYKFGDAARTVCTKHLSKFLSAPWVFGLFTDDAQQHEDDEENRAEQQRSL